MHGHAFSCGRPTCDEQGHGRPRPRNAMPRVSCASCPDSRLAASRAAAPSPPSASHPSVGEKGEHFTEYSTLMTVNTALCASRSAVWLFKRQVGFVRAPSWASHVDSGAAAPAAAAALTGAARLLALLLALRRLPPPSSTRRCCHRCRWCWCWALPLDAKMSPPKEM